jgi:hypothetical protein
MKHHWKNLSIKQHLIHSECTMCGCQRMTRYNRVSHFTDTSYRLPEETEYHRTRPECQDKVSLELPFGKECAV